MTNEEAISQLKTIRDIGREPNYLNQTEAINIAISALSVPNGEYIKKKDAITLFQRVGVGSFDFDNYTPEQAERFIINQLNNLPTYSFPKREKGDFEGMTNGEVLKSIFPTAELILGNSDYIPNVLSVKEEWWNAPYKAESEE